MQIKENSTEKIQAEIRNLLDEYNRANVGADNHELMALSIFKNHELIAGLNGGTYWGYLYVDSLFVGDKHRNQGIGRQLVSRAEEISISRGCEHASIDTHDFQGLQFYKKLGYEVIGKLPDLPPGHCKYHLYKSLDIS